MTSQTPNAVLLFLILPVLFSTFSPSFCQDNGGTIGFGYTVDSTGNGTSGASVTARLKLINATSVFGPDIQLLSLTATYETRDRLRVRITDANSSRWEIPNDIIPRPGPGNATGLPESSNLVFTLRNTTPFGFTVTRRSTNETLFDATPVQGNNSTYLIFKNQYLQISSALPPNTSNLYGLGEHTKNSFRLQPNQIFTMWNADIPSASPDVNLYGSHPFYLDVRSPNGSSHGVFLFNSNGMDVEYSGDRITYKVIGGVLDFYFFAGPTPELVVQQYTELIGRPAQMPDWAFGFHQCRYGYRNVDDLENVTANYARANIPLETMWTDIDYMDSYQVFTLDPVNFPLDRMKSFVDRLHNSSQKYVVIADPGIAINDTYGTYQRGLAADIYIKRNGTPYRGRVWPGDTYFPDFNNPSTQDYWANEIKLFRQLLPVDGLWIDMNEIANFISSNENVTADLDSPPYKINCGGNRRPINDRTVPASALHFGNLTEYDVHNLYGLLESRSTAIAFANQTGERPFVLTRSNFPGTGAHAAHWTGDNAANWNDLAYSIPAVLSHGLFGIPMVGADICGFIGDTNEELCRRWIQLGAFYPFSRDHSAKNTNRRELYLWESVAASARKALGLRYRMLPYFYTLMNEAHVNGTPIARPLFFTFPNDPNTYGINSQFLIGKGVLVSPVVQPGASNVEAYFPAGNWFDLFNRSAPISLTQGTRITLDAPEDHINVFALEGTILPMQGEAMTTAAAKKTPFRLWVALSSSGKNSTGQLYLDNGVDIHVRGKQGSWSLVTFNGGLVGNRLVLESEVVNGGYAVNQNLKIDRVSVHGLTVADYDKIRRPRGGRRGRKLLNAKVQQTSSGFVSLEFSNMSLPVGKKFTSQIAPSFHLRVFH